MYIHIYTYTQNPTQPKVGGSWTNRKGTGEDEPTTSISIATYQSGLG